jgi:hypothetical protein
MRRSRQQPKITSRRLTYDRPAIVRNMIKNPVVPVEGTKGRDLKLSIIAAFDYFGSTFGDLFFPRDASLAAGI